ncbi:ATP-dependent DNA helicase Q4 isoform X2 [Parasteatoda tepidariorum]
MIKRFKTVQSVNLIPSTVGFIPQLKPLQFDQNVNADWLERCDFSLSSTADVIKTSKEVHNKQTPSNKKPEKNELNDDVQKKCELTENKQCFHEMNETKQNYYELNESKHNSCQIKESKQDSADIAKTNSLNELKALKHSPVTNSFVAKHNSSNEVCSEKFNFSSQNEKESDNEISSKDDSASEKKPPSKRRKLNKSSGSSIEVLDSSKKASHLKRKIASGSLNENFIRLDIKKKKFSRGFRSTNVRKLKWNKWKQMKKASSGADKSNITGCFKCGEFGHWARNCTSVNYAKEKMNEEFENEELDDLHLPTLEEAAKLLREKDNKISTSTLNSKVISIPDENDPSVTYEIKDFNIFLEEEESMKGSLEPLYTVGKNGKMRTTPKAVYDALKEMGYSNFRDGQEIAIMRVLSGLSTMVVLPTGSGKSLCYQLPAYMYAKFQKSFAIVVSPLVSLMEDQVTGLPSCLHAVCLHSGMSDSQKTTAIELISDGKVQIVLVSPEAVISYGFLEKLQLPNMPAISFVCIDEVHCLSQWSHNFRPSYLQLHKVLTQKLGVKCILGLTATATRTAITDIITHLNLDSSENSVVGQTNVPQNLHLSISRDKDKDRALIQLLSGDRFHNCSSIIIYCIRRVETERLAALIRTCMQDEVDTNLLKEKKKSKSKKRCFKWTAEAYHAGLAPPRRRSIQKKFMSGKLRVVIATIAFGMGLDKPDVRAIIHYNMPKNFESYVQEIGRAGRDGLDSHCHLFLDSEQNDLWEQQRHIYSDGIDRHTLRKLLKKVFLPCKCSSSNTNSDTSKTMTSDDTFRCSKHEIAFSINDTVQELDVKQENISTLLCYLELHSNKWIEILSPTYATCSIRCYGGPQQMHNLALKNPVISAAIALDAECGKIWKKSSQYTFDVIRLSSAIGCKSSVLKRELRKLEWKDKRKTGVMVEFSDLSFHVMAPGNLCDEERDLVLDFLYNKVLESEKAQLKSLRLLFATFQKYSSSHYWECCDEVNMEYSMEIKNAINQYFDQHDSLLKSIENEEANNEIDTPYVKQLIKDIICTHRDQNFSGRAIARIFHGITSPCFPSEVWGKVRKFWRCLLPVDFNSIMKMANEELRNLR